MANSHAMNVIIPLVIFLIIDLTILYKSLIHRARMKSHTQKAFILFALATIWLQFVTVISYSGELGLIKLGNSFFNYFLIASSITGMALAGCFWLSYLILNIQSSKRIPLFRSLILLIPSAVAMVAGLSSYWTKSVFYLDENGVYHTGPLFFLEVACPFCYIFASIILAYIFLRRGKGKIVYKMLGNFLSFIIPAVVGALIQIKVARGGYSQIGISLCLILMYLEQYMEEINRSIKLQDMAELNAALKQRMSIIQSMCNIYFAAFFVNLKENTFVEINNEDFLRNKIGDRGEAQQSLWYVCENMLDNPSEEMRNFVDLSTVDERLADKDFVTCDYQGKVEGWCQLYIIAGDRREDGSLENVFIAARTIHDEKAREQEQNKKLEAARDDAQTKLEEITALKDRIQDAKDEVSEALGVIEALSSEYHTIWIVDKDNLKMKLIRAIGVTTIPEEVKNGGNYADYWIAFDSYIGTFVVPEDRERFRNEIQPDEILKRIKNGATYSINYLRRDENGNVGYHQVAFSNVNIEGRSNQFVIGFRDIDRLTKEEQAKKKELLEAKQAAEAANDAKTSFLFNMSHDIRTPMNAIIGFRELLEKHQDDPEKRADYLRKMDDASTVLLSIINNVLEMARIEKGTLEIVETPWDTKAFSDTIYSMFNELMEQKNIEFTTAINVTHRYVYCDPLKLREIFINILSNALKYTNPGGRVSMVLDEMPYDKEGWTLFRTTISDNGIGMSEEFLPHIFEEFTRETNSSGNKIEGTGLGMPIVKHLVNHLNGRIEVNSKKGVGTTFVVYIPHQIAENAVSDDRNSAETDIEALKGKRILLAEDNEINKEIATAILEEKGFIVEHANDGEEAVKMVNDASADYYDLILMDVQMPNMNGYMATRIIRTMDNPKKANIPILAMTANAFEEDKREALRNGMNGHVAKPIDVEAMMREIAISIR